MIVHRRQRQYNSVLVGYLALCLYTWEQGWPSTNFCRARTSVVATSPASSSDCAVHDGHGGSTSPYAGGTASSSYEPSRRLLEHHWSCRTDRPRCWIAQRRRNGTAAATGTRASQKHMVEFARFRAAPGIFLGSAFCCRYPEIYGQSTRRARSRADESSRVFSVVNSFSIAARISLPRTHIIQAHVT